MADQYNGNTSDEDDYNEDTGYQTGGMNEQGEYHYTYQQTPPHQSQTSSTEKKTESRKKKRSGVPTWLRVVGLALVFGIVASLAFQGTNWVVNRVSGNSGTTAATESTEIQSSRSSSNSGNITTVVSGGSDITEIAENALPSIVSITNLSVQEVNSWFGQPYQEEVESMGSGIIIAQNDTELLIVTNNHVVEGNESLTVTFIDESSANANVKGTDSSLDVAVIEVNLDELEDSTKEAISLAQMGDSSQLRVGETAIAIGNALGYGQSVTTGIISALDRQIEGYDGYLIQTDAAINPGNSGGALLNSNGEVIGINVAKLASDEIEGMGYAIPISNASEVINTLMNRETRTKVSEDERGYLGITGYDVTSDSAQMYNMPVGVYIRDVVEGGGADAAGITKGSIITNFEGITITGMSELQEQLAYYKAGETVSLTVQEPASDGEYEAKTVTVTLGTNSQ